MSGGLEGVLDRSRPPRGLRKVIRLQRERFPQLRWVRADLRRMPKFKDRSMDVVIEKALMDGEGAFLEWPQMFAEVARVLRPGGRGWA